MDLYKILGLKRNASEAAIRKAYRRAAMKDHPDRNPGDDEAAERFRQIDIAHKVLSDPERKKKYDETGTWEEVQQMSNTEKAVYMTLSNMLREAIQTMIGNRVKPSENDVVATMRGICDRDIRNIRESLKVAQNGLAGLESSAGRFESDDGSHTTMNDLINSFLADTKRQIALFEDQLKVGEEVKKRLQSFRWRREARVATAAQYYQISFTS